MSAFTPRESARDVFNVARSVGRGRVMGADPAETYRARRETWMRALARVNAAVGTPRVLAREPGDVDLARMESYCQGELDRLDAAEGSRVRAERTARQRALVEPTTTLVGPRTWLQPDGTFR